MSEKIDDYLQQGVYGQLQTKPDERRKFLGTIRERIVIALFQPQLREEGIYPQVEEALKENRQARLYLNGHMNYANLSKYIKVADKYKVEYTLVTNNDHNSEIGLVLAYDHAIDKEEIYVKKKETPKEVIEKPAQKGVFSFISKVLRRRGQ